MRTMHVRQVGSNRAQQMENIDNRYESSSNPHRQSVASKINDEIDTYKNTVDTQIETAIKDKMKPGLKTERDRKRTQEFVRDKMNKRLKSLYKHNLTDPDDQKRATRIITPPQNPYTIPPP